MPRFDDTTKANLNTAFAERLERIDPPTLDVLVETQPGRAEQVAERITGVEGLQFQQTGIIAGRFIPATVPEDSLPQLTRVEGVELVHQDQPVSIAQEPSPLGGGGAPEFPSVGSLPFLTPENDPVREAVSDVLFDAWTPDDTFVGRVRISEVEVPRFNFAQLPPGDPSQTFFSGLDVMFGTNTTGRKYLPTKESVEFMRDSSLTDGAAGADTKAGVIDTGHTPIEPANGGRMPFLFSAVPGEPPLDFHGHGSWCTNTVAAQPAPATAGTNVGVAPQVQHGHFKSLNTFPGFGRTSWILRSMEAANEWGADVISMSLGGAQQGPITEDPFCTFIRDTCKENAGDEEGSIYVIAAGNSGPGAWTIGSPGVSEKAITVASWSLTDDAPAIWSSRGPQGPWYDSHRDEFAADRDQFGSQEFVKPDIAAPGGGRENQAKMDQADEFLQQTEVGWMEGLFDGLKDTRGYMHGTSVCKDTLVPTPDGPTEITELGEGDAVFSLGDGGIEVDEVAAFLDHGEQSVYEMETDTRRVTITEDHPVLVVDREEETYYDAPNLKETRTRVGLTQQALADATDIPVSAIKSYENRGDAIPEKRAEIIEDAISAASDIRGSESVTRYECEECGHSWAGNPPGELSTVPRCSECRTTSVKEDAVADATLELVEKRTEIRRNGFEWKMVGQIDEGDPIAVVDELPCGEMPPRSPYDGDVVSEEAVWLLGAYAGDGWTDDSIASFAFPEGEKPRGELVEKAESELSPTSMTENEQEVRVFGNHVEEWFEKSGVGHGAKGKVVPQWMHTQPREQKVAFVAGYAEADGHLNTRGQLVFECANEDLMRGMKHLLDGMGFRTGNIRYRKRTNPWKETRGNQPGHQDEAEMWTLRVIGADSVEEIVGDVHVDPGRQTKGISRETRNLDVPDGIRAGRVKSIEHVGEKPVYDIETAENHNFLAENTVTHNSQATPHVAGLVVRLYEAGIVRTAADVKQVARTEGLVPTFDTAAENANRTEGGKNVSVGFGPFRESLFDPDEDTPGA